MSEIITGRNSVYEALLSGKQTVNKILISRQAHGSIIKKIISLAKEKKIPLHHVPPQRLDSFKNKNNQGIVAEISPIEYLDLNSIVTKIIEKDKPFLVVLDGIEDPHNLGAIIRNAVAFNANGIIIGKWRSAALTDTVYRTSAGSVEHIHIARVSNIADCLKNLKNRGFHIIGAEADNKSLEEVSFNFPLVLVIGSEGQGLQKLVKERCDSLVSIPHVKTIGSLNASCAAAILFFEIFKGKK